MHSSNIVPTLRRAAMGGLGLICALVATPDARSAPAPRQPARATPIRTPGGRLVALPIFKDGIRLFDAGYYQKALDKFKLAYFHFPSPKILTRIALCYKWLGKYVDAIRHYELFLKLSKPKKPAAPNTPPTKTAILRKAVRATVKALLKKIGQLKLRVSLPKGAVVRLNGAIVGKAPLKKLLRLTPGKYHITVSAPKHHPLQRDVKLKAAQVASLVLKLKPIKKKIRTGGAAADDI